MIVNDLKHFFLEVSEEGGVWLPSAPVIKRDVPGCCEALRLRSGSLVSFELTRTSEPRRGTQGLPHELPSLVLLRWAVVLSTRPPPWVTNRRCISDRLASHVST